VAKLKEGRMRQVVLRHGQKRGPRRLMEKREKEWKNNRGISMNITGGGKALGGFQLEKRSKFTRSPKK